MSIACQRHMVSQVIFTKGSSVSALRWLLQASPSDSHNHYSGLWIQFPIFSMWICSSLSEKKKRISGLMSHPAPCLTYWPSWFLVYSWTLGRVLASSRAFLNFQVHSFFRLWSSACSYWWVRKEPSISDPSGSASCIHLYCIWNKSPPCGSSPYLSSFSQSPFPSRTLQLSKCDQALGTDIYSLLPLQGFPWIVCSFALSFPSVGNSWHALMTVSGNFAPPTNPRYSDCADPQDFATFLVTNPDI